MSKIKDIVVHALEMLERDELIEVTSETLDCLSTEEFNECIAHTDHKYEVKSNSFNSLDSLHDKIIEWAKARKIIPNGNTMTQAIKTLEEVHELIRAIDRKDKTEIDDAYGDIFVTICIGAYLNGEELAVYVEDAYDVIKDRTGTLLPNGDFVKDDIHR